MAGERRKLKTKDKSKNNASKVLIGVLISVMVILVAIIAAGIMIVYHYIGMIQYQDPDDTQYDIPPGSDVLDTDDPDDPYYNTSDSGDDADPGETMPPQQVVNPGDVQWEEIDLIDQNGLINIMLVGQDRRPGQGRQRSDTMMLCSINPETKQVALISFLRDTYVQIPGGYKDNRLNVPYANGGFKLMKETFKQNFGLTINGCFECDFNNFIEIIDMLGGVDMDITTKEANHMKSFMGVSVKAGTNVHLNGQQALAYSRIRKIDSDWGRTNRQRKVINALFEKFKNSSISELNTIANQILPKLSTDMTSNEIMALLTKLLPMASSVEISSYSVPSTGEYTNAKINGASVLIPNLSKIRERLVNECLPIKH